MQQLRSDETGGEVAVTEPEPVRRSQLHELLERSVGLSLYAEAALFVDHTGEPVGHEIGVGRDMQAEGRDVVRRVGDHGKAVFAEHVEQAPGELCAPGASRKQDDQGFRRWSFVFA